MLRHLHFPRRSTVAVAIDGVSELSGSVILFASSNMAGNSHKQQGDLCPAHDRCCGYDEHDSVSQRLEAMRPISWTLVG